MATNGYVHGYSDRENERLCDQADTLAELLHRDTRYPAGSEVLEAGCGVGGQTVLLALPFATESFDHVFVCFVLEHLREPLAALERLQAVLKPGGTITATEGDHGSAYFCPESSLAMGAIRCLIEVQARTGGNALIGRQLHPLLCQAGFREVVVSPRFVYVDASRRAWVEGFTPNTSCPARAGREADCAQTVAPPYPVLVDMGLLPNYTWRWATHHADDAPGSWGPGLAPFSAYGRPGYDRWRALRLATP